MEFSVYNEYDPLRCVLVGDARKRGALSVSNEQTYHTLRTNMDPSESSLIQQVDQFADVLEANGVRVLRPDCTEDLTQIFTRDIGFVVGDTLFRAPMSYERRLAEWACVPDGLRSKAVEFESPGAKAEGGDVVLANDTVFVGVGHRTTHEAAAELARRVPLRVVEIPLRAWSEAGRDPDGVLHLDCAFVPIGVGVALIYPPAIGNLSVIEAQYQGGLIAVNREEKFFLGTNVIAIGNGQVISTNAVRRLNVEMRRRGFDVIEVDYGAVTALGGALRCSTMPIQRTL